MQPFDPYRKKPGQARSTATVEAIFEATARILQNEGIAALNTNAIARLAGISIGTLYQYFADKKAILIALARRELDFTQKTAIDAMTRTDVTADPEPEPIRAAVRALIKGFGGRQRARKLLIEALVANGLTGELSRPVDAAMQAIVAHQARANGAGAMSPVAVYVMTRALIGAIRAAVMEQSPYLNRPEFEDEMVRLISGYAADASHRTG